MLPPNSYDELPYDGSLRLGSSPDTLATAATLLGLRPAPVERCRVLEIGCATGSNLMPLALALPDSRFLGIDFSARQIGLARERAALVGLPNLELRVQNLLDPDESLGTFDYVIAHGVYSWVPPAVQERLLAVCARRLAPNGVAYVSYNTYPGWHLRMPVRDMLRAHTAAAQGAAQRVQQARDFLTFLAQSAFEPSGVYGSLLRKEARGLSRRPDYYLFHEQLEEDNHPVYFAQFMERAAAHGLQFLCEANPLSTLAPSSSAVQEALRKMAPDLLQQEQYLDFLCNRGFRRTLLCHADLPLNRTPGLAELTPLRAGSQAKATSGSINVRSADEVKFQTRDGAWASTRVPLFKAALVTLEASWPRWLGLDELLAASAASLETERVDEADRCRLAETLLQSYAADVIELHAHQPRLAATVSERPCASPLARLQARTSATVANLHCCLTRLDEFERLLLPHLDGQLDRHGLLSRLQDNARAPEKQAEPNGVRSADELEHCLNRLARKALLLA